VRAYKFHSQCLEIIFSAQSFIEILQVEHMKCCYLIQTHKNPEQIFRLVRLIKYSSPNSQVIISHDAHVKKLPFEPIQDLQDVHLLQDTKPRFRGDFSLIKPYLDTVSWLREHNSTFDWLIYLSGQDYPVTPIPKIEDFLGNTEYDGFIDFWKAFSEESVWDQGKFWKRYYCQYQRFPKVTVPLLKAVSDLSRYRKKISVSKLRGLIPDVQPFLTYGPLIGTPSKTTPFNNEYHCFGGFQWHTLSRKCVDYIYEYILKHPALLSYYKRTVVPDESLIQTILVNSNKFNLCNDNKRYADTYERKYGHARTLTVADYEMLVASEYHFARKFDIDVDSRILEKLDSFLRKNHREI